MTSDLSFSQFCVEKVWDENLAKSAEAWAAACIWDHGPPYLMRFLGQNLSVRTGRISVSILCRSQIRWQVVLSDTFRYLKVSDGIRRYPKNIGYRRYPIPIQVKYRNTLGTIRTSHAEDDWEHFRFRFPISQKYRNSVSEFRYSKYWLIRYLQYQSILQLVKPWYDEVKDYAFPYPQDCNPRCPLRCYGPMCTHYTQMVWATTNRVGCAINTCHNMNVWGSVWRRAVYLVCNYSPKLSAEMERKMYNLSKQLDVEEVTNMLLDDRDLTLNEDLGEESEIDSHDEVEECVLDSETEQDADSGEDEEVGSYYIGKDKNTKWNKKPFQKKQAVICGNCKKKQKGIAATVCKCERETTVQQGNWIGEAPYKVGVPCSACPPSYGGSCTDNQCFPGVTSNYLYWFK
ncbi:unnamed protein product [Ranitomeya imitator]|uniref:SCP domain-containing protein n=1 Tax=Ranitomeya imitator TaxID=111125 RepID=A0ABN9MAX5_9NEOB|nr:unnamed protein product [Ranitomeya imitator]